MASDSEKSAKSSGVKGFIVASFGVSILGLLFGFFIATSLLQVDEAKTEAKVETVSEDTPADAGHGTDKKAADDGEGGTAEEEEPKGPFTVVRLQPVVTNLSGSEDIWVRFEGSMLFDSKSEENPDLLATKLAQHVLAYLRTLKLTDLQGNGAVNAIVEDLNEIATTVTAGQAQGILVSGLVFE